MLAIGNPVPAFDVKDHNDEIVSNVTLIGKKYILFFYGQDDTPTCSKQVFSANEILSTVESKGYLLYGVSPDSVKKNQKFTKFLVYYFKIQNE